MSHGLGSEEIPNPISDLLPVSSLVVASNVVFDVLTTNLIQKRQLLLDQNRIATEGAGDGRGALRAFGWVDGGIIRVLRVHPMIHGDGGDGVSAFRKVDVADITIVLVQVLGGAEGAEDGALWVAVSAQWWAQFAAQTNAWVFTWKLLGARLVARRAVTEI